MVSLESAALQYFPSSLVVLLPNSVVQSQNRGFCAARLGSEGYVHGNPKHLQCNRRTGTKKDFVRDGERDEAQRAGACNIVHRHSTYIRKHEDHN